MIPDARKLDAIKHVALPSTGEALRPFLGLATYLGSHSVPHFSSGCSLVEVVKVWRVVKCMDR